MLENGADIRYIQALLGHAELTTTEVYTRVAIVKLKQIHTATHPARTERAGGDKNSAVGVGMDSDAQAFLDAIGEDDEEGAA